MAVTDENRSIETVQVTATGRVQRIGYRQWCVQQAQALGIAGWVRNCRDGSVQAWLQGEPGNVAAMREHMRRGPPGAHVTELRSETVDTPERLTTFEQRATV